MKHDRIRRSVPATPRTWAEVQALAATARGITHPLLTRTDAQVAQAMLAIDPMFDSAEAKLARMDVFFAAHGVRRGDDLRGSAGK